METHPVIPPQPSLPFFFPFVSRPCQQKPSETNLSQRSRNAPPPSVLHALRSRRAVQIQHFSPSSYSTVGERSQIRDNRAIWKLLRCLAVMDHVEGMSAALGFVIINPGRVRENPASLSIKDALITTVAQAPGCLFLLEFQLCRTANHGARPFYLSLSHSHNHRIIRTQ